MNLASAEQYQVMNDANTKFVILSTQRSGSTWVADVLGRFEGVKTYGELLLRQKRTWDVGETDYPRFIEAPHQKLTLRPLSVYHYLDEFYSIPGTLGFKLMYSQIRQNPEVMLFLRMRQVKVIHLVRQNSLDVIISKEVAKARGRAHLLSSQEKLKPIEIYLHPQKTIAQIKWQQRKVNFFQILLKVLRQSHINVVYEQLVADVDRFLSISDFLSVVATDVPKSGLTRIRQTGHKDELVNFLEVKEALYSSGLGHLIQGDDHREPSACQ